MCVLVRLCSNRVTEPWDRHRVTINIPASLPADTAIRFVRVVLAELGAEQPESGAVCWCGEPIELLAVPQQRRSDEVIHLGT